MHQFVGVVYRGENDYTVGTYLSQANQDLFKYISWTNVPLLAIFNYKQQILI